MPTYKLMEPQDAKKLAAFEAIARETEPDAFFGTIDTEQYEKQILTCAAQPAFQNTYVVLAIEGETVVGRCDFAIIGSFVDGGKIGYVDWVYTLKAHRHRGIAQGMFSFMEQFLKGEGVGEYFLITAHNREAQRFYGSFLNIRRETDWILRKTIE